MWTIPRFLLAALLLASLAGCDLIPPPGGDDDDAVGGDDDDDDDGDPCNSPPNPEAAVMLCHSTEGGWPNMPNGQAVFGVFEFAGSDAATWWFDADDGTRYRFTWSFYPDGLMGDFPTLDSLGRVGVVTRGVCPSNLSAFRATKLVDADDPDWTYFFTTDAMVENYGYEAETEDPGNEPSACAPQLYDWCPGGTYGCAPYDWTLTTPLTDPVTLRQGESFETDDGYLISLNSAFMSHDGSDWLWGTFRLSYTAIDLWMLE